MTVGELIELLSHHAYRGKVPGLVITGPTGTKLDFIFLP
jgi:hypothetical protein